jgi:2-polyprenyl-6-methoxyphenol hydroxylase-like FAD-dependent oxidoreductase
MNAPILIIGAGPVGMTMASELARYGVPIRIIDKAAHRTDRSKALVIWSRTLELLDRVADQLRSLMLGSRPKRLTSSPATRS